jgi:hypothetical protein
MGSDYDDADRFRRQAKVCREEAAKAGGNPVDAASWLRLAEDFDQRAQQLHRALERRLSKLEPS